MDYHQYQKSVFDYLLNRHQKDKTFTFSVRQKASKGAERNYFIGTEKSYYFGFTCWDIPVYFAGSATDLFNFFFFAYKDESLGFRFQYSMTKMPHDEQNKANLELGHVVIEELKRKRIEFEAKPKGNKMLYFEVHPEGKGYNTVEELMKAFEEVYDKVSPVIDDSIAIVKRENPDWDAGRYEQSRFDNLVNRMHERIEKFSQPGIISNDTEGEGDDDPDITPLRSLKAVKGQITALNTILYGPPGTGKTYHTINKSVAIANPDFDIASASREKLKEEYEKLVKEGQIEFVTFHQSMSYEDFIEGIKPMEPKEGDPFLKYEIKEGIFKRLCDRASKVPEAKPTGFSISESEFQKAGFYKLSLGDTSNPDDDQIYSWCIKNGYIALGYGDAIDFTGKNENEIQQMVPVQLEKFAAQAVNYFINYQKAGDYVVVTYGNLQFRAIGKVTGNYEFKTVNGLNVHQFRKVEWLLKDAELPYEEVYNKQFSQQTLYRLDKREIKKDFFVKAGQIVKTQDNKTKNYVLIIDEINRGNVSQIFGELITLIEDDKRSGKVEALTVTLPYSKKTFSVPPNLYIIGTMNTADRSVEALDTALRRRFVFAEIIPNPSLLDSYHLLKQLWIKHKDTYEEDEEWKAVESKFVDLFGMTFINKKKYNDLKPYEDNLDEELNELSPEDFKEAVEFKNGLDLVKLLLTINRRLTALLNQDHTIGHAWVMNIFCLEDLQAVFKNKILPLLQELFYNDYAKIGLVLGRNFVDPKLIGQKMFADFDDGNELASEYADKVFYALKNPYDLTLKDFISIYQ